MSRFRELLCGTPLENEETFSAPWEARSFAIALRLAETGVFTWDEFRRHLIDQIARAEKVRAHAWIDSGEGYYTHFMRALEAILGAGAVAVICGFAAEPAGGWGGGSGGDGV